MEQMKVKTIIQNVLPDGTIIKVNYSILDVISLSIARTAPDEIFIITNLDVISRDERILKEAVIAIQDTVRTQGIELIILL